MITIFIFVTVIIIRGVRVVILKQLKNVISTSTLKLIILRGVIIILRINCSASSFPQLYLIVEITGLVFVVLAIKFTTYYYGNITKYFILNGFASGIFGLGRRICILNGCSIEGGYLNLVSTNGQIGVWLIFISLLIKGGILPFSRRLLDVYKFIRIEGLGFFIVRVKIIYISIRIIRCMKRNIRIVEWIQFFCCMIGTINIVIGTIIAIGQISMKRFLGFSSFRQSGYILIRISTNTLIGIIVGRIILWMYRITSIIRWYRIIQISEEIKIIDSMSRFNYQPISVTWLILLIVVLINFSMFPFRPRFALKFILGTQLRRWNSVVIRLLLVIGLVSSFNYIIILKISIDRES
jgi:NADH:ubiquinone oxidoreductase subunit 2 (subunit N)